MVCKQNGAKHLFEMKEPEPEPESPFLDEEAYDLPTREEALDSYEAESELQLETPFASALILAAQESSPLAAKEAIEGDIEPEALEAPGHEPEEETGEEESPFFDEELFIGRGKGGSEPRAAALAAESPFQGAFERGRAPSDSLEMEELRSFDEESFLDGEMGVINGENRVRVKNTFGVPWRWICKIFIRDNQGRLHSSGTGVLIANRHILTAAHVVYAEYIDPYKYSIEVAPALNEGDELGTYSVSVKPKISKNYDPKAQDHLDWDYALVTLNQRIGKKTFSKIGGGPLCYWGHPTCGANTIFVRPEPRALNGKAVLTAGYPTGKGGKQLWCAAGLLHSADSRRRKMGITADTTQGQSGSPIWIVENGRYRLVGIAVGAGKQSNSAVRVTRELIRQLRAWITEDGDTPSMVETEERPAQTLSGLEAEHQGPHVSEWSPEPSAEEAEDFTGADYGEDELELLHEQPLEEQFNPSTVPKDVADALAKPDWPLALKLAIQAGWRDENELTNMIFFTRHPELPPTEKLDPAGKDFKKLSAEWSKILDKEVWKAIEASAKNTDLVVSGKEVADHHRRYFTGKSGKRLKKLVEDAAMEVDINPGLLGTVMMAETRRPSSYLSSGKVRSYHIGADDFYEGRHAIRARVPAYNKVKWDKNQTPDEHLNDAKTNKRMVKTILFDSGPDAVLATAVYLKFREERLREIAKEQGKDFGALPLATRIALTRIAMAAGTGGATPYLKNALNGKDIFVRRDIPVRAFQTKRNATVRTAQAMHLSDWVFGITVPGAVLQPEMEEYEWKEPGMSGEDLAREKGPPAEGTDWEEEAAEYDGESPYEMAEAEAEFGEAAEAEEAPEDEEAEPLFEFEGVKPPKGLKLAEHYYTPKNKGGTAGTIKVMDQQGMNPGFVSELTDNILVDRRSGGLQTKLDNLIRTKYARYLATRSSAQESAKVSDRLRVALVDLTGTKLFEPDPAGWGSIFATDGASVPKICALYAVHQLRGDLNHLAVKHSYEKKDDLIKGAKAYWKKVGFSSLPRIAELFTISEAADHSRAVTVAFTPGLVSTITRVYKDNSNCAMDQLISQIGFPYIASVMWQSGLRHHTRGGLWLGGGYCCTNKELMKRLQNSDMNLIECKVAGTLGSSFRWKFNAMREPKPVFPHNATALSVATFFALIAQGRLVDDTASGKISKTLEDACSKLWDAQLGGLSSTPPTKCGDVGNLLLDGILVKRTVGGKVITYAAAALTIGAADFPFPDFLEDLDKLIRDKN